MKNYSEDPSRQYHIQVAKGEVGRYVTGRSETLQKDRTVF